MTHPREYLPVLDRIGIALDAGCDALMTLQAIDVLPSMREGGPVGRHIEYAISHLRSAIGELRDAQTQGQTGLALGFVLARDARHSTGDGGPDQSSPRRTA